jgi:hypothetical protein
MKVTFIGTIGVQTGQSWHQQANKRFLIDWNLNHELGTGLFLHNNSSAVKRVQFVTDRMAYIRGHWCEIIVLKVYAPTEDEIDDVKDSF